MAHVANEINVWFNKVFRVNHWRDILNCSLQMVMLAVTLIGAQENLLFCFKQCRKYNC